MKKAKIPESLNVTLGIQCAECLEAMQCYDEDDSSLLECPSCNNAVVLVLTHGDSDYKEGSHEANRSSNVQ